VYQVGLAAVGGPALGAVQDPAVAFGAGASSHAGRVDPASRSDSAYEAIASMAMSGQHLVLELLAAGKDEPMVPSLLTAAGSMTRTATAGNLLHTMQVATPSAP